MSDDKSKQESQFDLDAIKESIDRMKPELSACSAAAHKAKEAALVIIQSSTMWPSLVL